MSKVIMRRDTAAWILQTYLSFGIAVFLCVVAVWNLPSVSIDRAFVALSMFFLLSSTFVLAKTLRDNQAEQVDTPAWRVQVWLAFCIAVSLSGWGMFKMNIEYWHKGFLIASSLFLLSTTFSLAKTIRDKHEADLINGPVAVTNDE